MDSEIEGFPLIIEDLEGEGSRQKSGEAEQKLAEECKLEMSASRISFKFFEIGVEILPLFPANVNKLQ